MTVWRSDFGNLCDDCRYNSLLLSDSEQGAVSSEQSREIDLRGIVAATIHLYKYQRRGQAHRPPRQYHATP